MPKAATSPHQLIAEYVRDLANRMELRDYSLLVSIAEEDRPDDEERNACAIFTIGRRYVFIWFDPNYVARATPQELRQTAVHELIHCHFQPAREVAINAVVAAFKKPGRTALLGTYENAQEYGVDAIAEALAPFMPLPPKVSA